MVEKKEKTDAKKSEKAESSTGVTKSNAISEANSGIDKRILVISLVLGLLIVISFVQAIELVALKSQLDSKTTELNSMMVSMAENEKTSVSSTASSNLQKNLSNLPSMVGGC